MEPNKFILTFKSNNTMQRFNIDHKGYYPSFLQIKKIAILNSTNTGQLASNYLHLL